MKKLVSFILLCSLQCAALLLWPLWWSTALIALIWASFSRLLYGAKPLFSLYFTAGLLSWIGAALYLHLSGSGLLLNRMAQMLHLPAFTLFAFTGIIGGILSGLAGLVVSSRTKQKPTH